MSVTMTRSPLVAGLLLAAMCIIYSAAQVDYTDSEDYPWPPRSLREKPSMRLRFGKRDGSTGVWGLTQRSMPSLRMRFGKRSWNPQNVQDLEGKANFMRDQETHLLEGLDKRGDERIPGLRLRFGKRSTGNRADDDVTREKFSNEE